MKFGTTYTNPYEIPSIMSLDWIPSFGISSMSTDPASVAGKEIYSRVRAAYSGSLDADAPDFMIYLGALDSVFSYLGYLKRMYRCLTTYTPENLALPDALLEAMGIFDEDAVKLRRDKTRLWQGINELILLSRKFKCPAVMDIFNRHYWMSDNVYADAATLRAQLYMFTLVGVYQLQDAVEDNGSIEPAYLQLVPIPGNFASLDDTSKGDHYICDTLLEFGRNLINALDAWDDCYTISGYLQRAYEGTPNFAVAELLQDEMMTAQYVPEVLAQIENSRTVLPATWVRDYTAMFGSVQVTQNVLQNAVVSSNSFTFKTGSTGDLHDELEYLFLFESAAQMSNFISIRSDNPSVADSVIASRLMAATTITRNGTGDALSYTLTAHCGTEIPLMWRVRTKQYLKPAGQAGAYQYWWVTLPAVAMMGYQYSSAGKVMNTVDAVAVATLSQFDWHPIMLALTGVQTFSSSASGGNACQLIPIGDVHNPTLITDEMLDNLNKICFYSEFNSFGL